MDNLVANAVYCICMETRPVDLGLSRDIQKSQDVPSLADLDLFAICDVFYDNPISGCPLKNLPASSKIDKSTASRHVSR